jgi:hypothetical protein
VRDGDHRRVVHLGVAFLDPPPASVRATVRVEVVGRNEVTVTRRKNLEESSAIRGFSNELEKGRPQQFGGSDHKDVYRGRQRKRVDRGDCPSHHQQWVAMISFLAAAGYAGGVEGAKEVGGIQLKRTAPRQNVEAGQRIATVETSPAPRNIAKEPVDADAGEGCRKLHHPLIGEGRYRNVIRVRIADPHPERALLGRFEKTAFSVEEDSTLVPHPQRFPNTTSALEHAALTRPLMLKGISIRV